MAARNVRWLGGVLLALGLACTNGSTPPPDPAPTCSDAAKNGVETDIDCGGS